MTYPRIRRMFLCALISCTALTSPGQTQTTGQLPPPPVRNAIDQNQVDIVSGQFVPPTRKYLSIGPDDHLGLSLDRVVLMGSIHYCRRLKLSMARLL